MVGCPPSVSLGSKWLARVDPTMFGSFLFGGLAVEEAVAVPLAAVVVTVVMVGVTT